MAVVIPSSNTLLFDALHWASAQLFFWIANLRVLIPTCQRSSTAGTLTSAYAKTATICSTESAFSSRQNLPSLAGQILGKLTLKMQRNWGGRSRRLLVVKAGEPKSGVVAGVSRP